MNEGTIYHLVVEASRMILFLAATIILWRKQKPKGIGIQIMALAVAWELITAPVMWIFGERMNQDFAVSFVRASWAFTTIGFALGLLLFTARSGRHNQSIHSTELRRCAPPLRE